MKATHIDYKKELEAAAKGMIMIHEPRLLIKLIVRTIVQKVQVKHAGMILYDPKKDSYVLTISRGQPGHKIPAGFARFDKNNPLIKLFTMKDLKPFVNGRDDFVIDDINKLIWKETVIDSGNGIKNLLHEVSQQMQMLNVTACVPAYFQDKLMAVLLLGPKNDNSRFDQEELNFFSALASDTSMAIRNAQLFADLKKEADKNKDLFIRTTIVLGSTIEAKDKYTHGHTGRVTDYSMAIARQMIQNGLAKFPENFLENLYIASLLHDIGKIAIPESILNKQGKLTPEEFEIIKQHTVRGVEILKPLSEFVDCLNGVRHHHERYDGKGYPDGLKGEEIPMMAAIISVADAFDAITTDRPYRKALSKDEALTEIKRNSKLQFRPEPVQALLELFELGKI